MSPERPPKGKRPVHGEQAEFRIESIAIDGLGRSSKARITGALPGERVRARIEHVGKNATFATTLEVLEARGGRRPAPCPRHREGGGRCTGCPLMTTHEEDQRAIKLAELARLGLEVERIEAPGPELGYRYSAKRVAFGREGALRLGSYRRGTHNHADMGGCLVDHPRITEAADELARVASEQRVAPYDETTKEGLLRYLWLKTDGERVLTTLVFAKAASEVATHLAEAMTLSSGVAVSVQAAEGNSWRGATAQPVRGDERLQIAFGDITTEVGPLGFMQPNPVVARALYDALVGESGGSTAFDLYAGAGVTTALLARRFERVIPCESHPESAALLGVEPMSAKAMLRGTSESPELVIANPPRKGLGPEVCAALIARAPSRVHLMSCGPEGLVRDLAALDADYRLERLQAFDTLPQTTHVELVAHLVRR